MSDATLSGERHGGALLRRIAAAALWPPLVAFCVGCLLPLAGSAADRGDDGELAEIERRVLTILPRIEAATVCIEGAGSGSGVVVSEDGLVLTAAHVVDGTTDVAVIYPDGRKVAAKALGSYGPADAAMVQITEGAPHPFVEVAEADSAKVGDTVVAMGHPAGFDKQRGIPLRLGHVIAYSNEYMATDCALISGDSGGPTFNLDGQVIGIHSHVAGKIAENNDGAIGSFLKNWEPMKQGKHHKVHYSEGMGEGYKDPWALGLKLSTDHYGEELIVDEVIPETPAARAGFQAGDRVLLIGNQTPSGAADFLQKSQGGYYGVNLSVKVARGESDTTLQIRLLKESQLPAARAAWSRGEDLPPTDEEAKLDREARERQAAPNAQPAPEKNPREDRPPSRLNELADEAKASGGRLRVSRDELLKLREKLSLRTRRLSPDGQRSIDDWSERMNSNYAPVARDLAKSVFVVHGPSGQVALATAIASDGLLLTKASEVSDRTIEVQLTDDRRAPATIVATDEKLDLALIRVADAELTPISFSAPGAIGKGRLCASLGPQGALAGQGVVSVGARSLDGKAGVYLGVNVEPHERGLQVKGVAPNSPAAQCNLRPGDVLTLIDGKMIREQRELESLIKSRQAEDVVRLEIERDESLLSAQAVLTEGPTVALPGAADLPVDGISTAVSQRRWNFPSGLQHDCAIRPQDCGGPLISPSGRVLGVNIARAGRIKSYAIPVADVERFVAAHLPAKPSP